MIYRFIFFFILSSITWPNQVYSSNSIYYSANSPRINSLGGCVFASDNISDDFNNPLNINSRINNKTYFSFYNYLNNSINVFQFTSNILKSDKHTMNFGIISRIVQDNFNTNLAWIYNGESPMYNDINYSNIYTFSDEEIGLLFSYHRKINQYIINTKIKPIFHFVDSDKAFGIHFDFFISRNFNNLNLMFGLIEAYQKKWQNGILEKYYAQPIISTTLKFEKLFSILNISEFNTKVGFEFNLSENLTIRLGTDKYKNHSYGFGLTFDMFDVDYCYYNMNELQKNIKQFSFSINFEMLKKISFN